MTFSLHCCVMLLFPRGSARSASPLSQHVAASEQSTRTCLPSHDCCCSASSHPNTAAIGSAIASRRALPLLSAPVSTLLAQTRRFWEGFAALRMEALLAQSLTASPPQRSSLEPRSVWMGLHCFQLNTSDLNLILGSPAPDLEYSLATSFFSQVSKYEPFLQKIISP